MANNTLTVVQRWVGDSKSWLETFLLAARSNPAIVAVVVMGSAVRQRGHRRSDFDLLILYRGKRPTIAAPIEVDIRWFPVTKVENLLAEGHEIVGWAMKFGTAILDPERIWENLSTSWHDRVPMPSAAEALERGRKSLNKAKEMLDAGDEDAASDLLLASLTQFVRARLIDHNVFPASRPELPGQLLTVSPSDPLAGLLEDAMYGEVDASELFKRIDVQCANISGA
jgi:predicted nucleotidyltransferase